MLKSIIRDLISGTKQGICLAIALLLGIVLAVLLFVNLNLLILTFVIGTLCLIALMGAGFRFN